MYRLVIDPQQKQDSCIILKPDQEHYLRRVVRLNSGDDFIAMDGKGNCWQVKLTVTGNEIVTSFQENRELTTAVSLIVALPKGSGFEDIIRCTTELGVTKLYPAISDRTLLKPKENKLERWRKIALEAVEQSERQILPYIAEPMPIKVIFEQFKLNNNPKYIASARSNASHLMEFCQQDFQDNPPSEIIIATGCEGGWTPREIENAIASGFQEVSLGKRILRAITAPIMVMALVASWSEIFELKSE
ncbi:16S rRNA (uracil(1498)-N(3))-methyltransferase [Cyanobacterium sp. Dongsha4]|uniref:16S rRNA (uracil(1498)-N(3))-methyltransferase n=1 Tax=Cyanobacterium sp. DS4 TaxID=2878255 RepID=UPI002E81E9CF|nr:16S rRNA (uracil(1498)-N(3))-methyltransferase [Cyanobacterium sp. Dongsha4]WVL01872.1 16S rRNA (uracil(1498)-N(3))-methyltransferase [Cyanobacterium sp. Dongsha4]